MFVSQNLIKMKKITLLTAFLVTFLGFSQANKQKIQTYLDNNRAKYGLTSQDVSDWTVVGEVSSTSTQITNYRVVQRYQGIELFDAQSNVWVKNNEVINLGNRFRQNVAQKVNTTAASLDATQALASAYAKFGYGSTAFTVIETVDSHNLKLSNGTSEDPIIAKLAFQPTADNKLVLAWGFQFYAPKGSSYWDVKIDATSGALLDKKDLTVSCKFGDDHQGKHDYKKHFNFELNAFNASNSMLVPTPGTYRVIPYNYESPNHHSFDLITTTGNALASPNGWHDANAINGTTASLRYTYTRGNNVLAQEDADGNNGTGIRADGGASLTFDFAYGGQTLLPTVYTSAATTNLFYMNNIMHDIWYQYGFDEANGNYQQNNLGRGGVASATGDYVQADSQDGYSQTTATLNNANFTPTNDGVRPRIQMFLWNLGAPPTNYITVNGPSPIAGQYAATTNVFDTTDRIPVPLAPNGIVSDLVLYNNNPTPPGYHSACQVPTNPFDLSGKIVLIKRGGCFFSLKVKNAQDAGALAVIVMDSIDNNPTRLSMSSTGVLGITIPAVFITKEIGDSFLAEMANGPLSVKLEVPDNLYLYADGDFDNVVIGHEYGHGISNRLVGGGLAGCMNNYEQMGEGWSDWFGLMNQIKVGDTGADPKEVGTFVINQPVDGFGIRDFPYSTDLTVNPRTMINSNAVLPVDPTVDTAFKYVVGEFWTSCLWDLTWAYINKYGFDPNIYTGTGGNNKVMRLVADALKLETCNGTNIVSGRDNLIAADQATTGGADYCLITDVFARRGVGLNASSGDINDPNDQVEDFTSFPAGPNCTLAVDYFANPDMFRVYPNPSNGLFNIRINQFVGKASIQIVDLNGRVVYTQKDADFNIEKTIDLSRFQAGMYILKVNNEQFNFSQKIMKN
jgi:hypothetical protein